MFDDRPEQMRREIEAAIRLRRKHTDLSSERIKQYMGSDHADGVRPDIESHENLNFDIVVNTLPAMIYQNPVVKVTSRRPRVQREFAKAVKHGMNRWVKDADFADKLESVALDLMFDFGVCLTGLEPLPGYEGVAGPPLRPSLTRISPRRYFMDPQAQSAGETRFRGHVWVRDKDDLLAAKGPDGRAMFDREAVRRLTTDFGLEDPLGAGGWMGGGGGGGVGMLREMGIERVERNEVVGYEVYVPERGVGGMIYTLAFQGDEDGVYLRPPRKAFCPPWGPYTLFGIYLIPDQIYPLAPLAVPEGLLQELNAHLDQISDQADEARQLTFYNGVNSKLGDAITNGRNGQVFGVPGFDTSQLASITIGGPSREQLDYVDRLRIRLDRKAAITEMQRGNLTGATATETSEVAAASDFRRKFIRRQFRKGAKRVMETACWYLVESSNVIFNAPMPAEGTLPGTEGAEMEDGVFIGGRGPGQEDFSFFDLELEIEAMEADDGTGFQKMQAAFSLVSSVVPMIPQVPFVNWREMCDDAFSALGIPDGARRYINWELVELFTRIKMMSGAAEAIPGLEGVPMPDFAAAAGPRGGAFSGFLRSPAKPVENRASKPPMRSISIRAEAPMEAGAGAGV